MTTKQATSPLTGLRCADCGGTFDRRGLHPKSAPLPAHGEYDADVRLVHYPDQDDTCGSDRRGWVVYVKQW